MATPILIFYILGLILFILGIELEEKERINKLIYFGLTFFVSSMAYYLSYLDTDYTYTAYLPLTILVLSIVMLLYTAWGMIPVGTSWDEQADSED